MYKGIIFNSSTVRLLSGAFADHVKTNHIRTAVGSNPGRGDVQATLDALASRWTSSWASSACTGTVRSGDLRGGMHLSLRTR